MSILGYSEIVKKITGEDEYSFENIMVTLSKHSLSSLRIKALKELAKQKNSTITKILKRLKENTTGGTHISIKSFFINLEKENILSKEKINNRTYWKFTDKYKNFCKYLTNQSLSE